jgi:hypothetical protein
MDGYWSAPESQVADCARDNWEQMQRICEEHPYAINWGPVRPTTPRMLGLHPGHPNPKWKTQQKSRTKKLDGFDQD